MQLMLMIWIQAVGMVVPVVLQDGGVTPSASLSDKSYQDIISLLVDEKNERSRFEATVLDRLNKIDDLHHQVFIQLDKDKNSREYQVAKLAEFAQQLRNLTDSTNRLSRLQHDFEAFKAVIDNQTRSDYLELSKNISIIGNKVASYNRKVGFSLKTPDRTQQPSTGPLKFTEVHLNTDHMYDGRTGLVTITVPGLYFITATIVREPGVIEAYCNIYRNGIYVNNAATVGYGSSTSGYASGSVSLVHHLKVGDTVSLRHCIGTDHFHWSSGFDGFLVKSD